MRTGAELLDGRVGASSFWRWEREPTQWIRSIMVANNERAAAANKRSHSMILCRMGMLIMIRLSCCLCLCLFRVCIGRVCGLCIWWRAINLLASPIFSPLAARCSAHRVQRSDATAAPSCEQWLSTQPASFPSISDAQLEITI